MRIYILTIILFILYPRLSSQDNFDPTQMIDWGDSVYDNFFNGTCQSTKKSAKSTMNTIYSQNDALWASKTYCYDNSGLVIGGTNGRGCNLTCCAMMLKNGANCNVDPGKLQNFLQNIKDNSHPGDFNYNGFSSNCGVSYIKMQTYTGNNNTVKWNNCKKCGNDKKSQT